MDRPLPLSPSSAMAPQQMQQQTAWLTRQIRQSDAQAASHYVRSVRVNVESVLECCFVLTMERLSPEERRMLIDGFVAHHGALEPAFHHIATECVRYVQHGHDEGTLNWPQQQLALFEFEWACLCVEIDEGMVSHVVQEQEVTMTSQLSLNPTLQLLELPFTIRQGAVVPTLQGNQFYALFRDPDHQVVTLRLHEWDVALIQLLQSQQGITLQAFWQQIQQVNSDFDLTEWSDHFYRLGLLTLSIGECLRSDPLSSY